MDLKNQILSRAKKTERSASVERDNSIIENEVEQQEKVTRKQKRKRSQVKSNMTQWCDKPMRD